MAFARSFATGLVLTGDGLSGPMKEKMSAVHGCPLTAQGMDAKWRRLNCQAPFTTARPQGCARTSQINRSYPHDQRCRAQRTHQARFGRILWCWRSYAPNPARQRVPSYRCLPTQAPHPAYSQLLLTLWPLCLRPKVRIKSDLGIIVICTEISASEAPSLSPGVLASSTSAARRSRTILSLLKESLGLASTTTILGSGRFCVFDHSTGFGSAAPSSSQKWPAPIGWSGSSLSA